MTSFRIGSTLYDTLFTFGVDGLLIDADSTPTYTVKKNGVIVAEAVTVTKRAATTGTYDWSFNPNGEIDGDKYTLEAQATIAGSVYHKVAVTYEAREPERGTDGANTATPLTQAQLDARTLDSSEYATSAKQDLIYNKVNTAEINVNGPPFDGGTLTLVKNKTYTVANDNALVIPMAGIAGLDTATEVLLTIANKRTGEKLIDRKVAEDVDVNGDVTWDIDGSELNYEPGGMYEYSIEFNHSGEYSEKLKGNHTLERDIAG